MSSLDTRKEILNRLQSCAFTAFTERRVEPHILFRIEADTTQQANAIGMLVSEWHAKQEELGIGKDDRQLLPALKIQGKTIDFEVPDALFGIHLFQDIGTSIQGIMEGKNLEEARRAPLPPEGSAFSTAPILSVGREHGHGI